MIRTSESLFFRLKELIAGKIGLNINERKLDELEKALLKGFSNSQYSSLQEYMSWLTRIPISSPDWRSLIEILTVNETYFFRNAPQLESLRSVIFPAIIDAKRQRNRRELRVWSAGCATGEEPYSIAIMLSEILPDFRKWNIFILGTDINHSSLEKAKAGFYREWSFRDVPQRIKSEYFTPQDGGLVIRPDIQQMVTYNYLNLVENCYPSFYNQTTDMDIIICRNVMIYFSNPTSERVIERFYQTLDTNGWLLVGHSEPMTMLPHNFATVNIQDALFYRKPDPLSAKEKSAHSVVAPWKSGESAMRSPKSRQGNSHAEKKIRTVGRLNASPSNPSRQQQHAEDVSEVNKLVAAGKWQEAIQTLTLKIQARPEKVDYYLDIAKIYANQKMPDQALRWCENALEKDRSYLPTYFITSLVYQELNRFADAERLLKQALYVNQDFLFGHFHLAMLYQKTGDLNKAKKIFSTIQRQLAELSGTDKLICSDGLTVEQMSKLVSTYTGKLDQSG
ncbi:MAG: CheR family methyltransferase [Candidatus Zhuqueibacterota bacterium]